MARRPVLAASLAFVAGVALGAWLPQEPDAWGWAGAALLAAWAGLRAAARTAAATRAGLLAFAVIGIFRCQTDLAPLYAGAETLPEGEAVAAGRVDRPAEVLEGDVLLHLVDVRLRRGAETVGLDAPLQVLVAGGDPYAAGDLVTARGKLRAIRGDRNLGWFPAPVTPRGRRAASRLVVSAPAWVRRDGHRRVRGAGAAVLRWRAEADAFWKERAGAPGAILNALTTGERASIPPQVQEAFLRSGLTHLLAISGMNVGFLAALVFLALRRALALWEGLALRFPVQPIAAGLTLPALWFFMLFSGSQIPVGRAVLSSGAALAAVVLWRRVDPADAWALAGLTIAAVDPRALFSASFQLSFAAVGALLLLAGRLRSHASTAEDAWPVKLRRGARSVLGVSLAASLATAALVAFHFQQVSLIGPLANLVAVPFTGFVVLPAGWVTLIAAAVSGTAGELAARFAVLPAQWLVVIASCCGAPHWAVLRTARPPLLLTACLLALACSLIPRPSRRALIAGVGACAAAALAAGLWSLSLHRRELLVAFLDVGQGLSAGVLLPGGGSLLYDAGPRWRGYDAGERVVVPALRRLGVSRLDVLAISHPHPDHDGGAEAVRRELAVGRELSGVGGLAPARGEEGDLGGGVRLRVLSAPAAPAPGAAGDTNDGSLALLLRYGDAGVLLTGDAGPAAAPGIVAAAEPLPAHLALQVPHHGGSAESARLYAAAVAPELSVISVGRNSFGHPKPGAVAALEAAGRVLRTDRDGAVFIRSAGRGLQVRTWRELSGGRTWPERVRWLVAGW